MNNFFMDTEFIDTGKVIQLVSIGIVSSNGAEYYAESSEFDPLLADDWVKTNVLDKLEGNAKPLRQIGDEIITFVESNLNVSERPRFWGYYSAWDWFLFCRAVSPTGQLLDMPAHWPNRCSDLAQSMEDKMYSCFMPKNDDAHNALSDAHWTKKLYAQIYNRK